MSESETADAIGEGAVSGNQVSIPKAIREHADIEDGDTLRWYWDDGELTVTVIRRHAGVFEDFEGFEGSESPEEPVDHDEIGLEPAGEHDADAPDAR